MLSIDHKRMPAVAIGQILFCKDCKNNKKKPLKNKQTNGGLWLV